LLAAAGVLASSSPPATKGSSRKLARSFPVFGKAPFKDIRPAIVGLVGLKTSSWSAESCSIVKFVSFYVLITVSSFCRTLASPLPFPISIVISSMFFVSSYSSLSPPESKMSS